MEEIERAMALDPTAKLVKKAVDTAHILPGQWTPVGRLDELPDGRPTRRTLGDAPVFVLRRGRQVDVLYDLCSHLSGRGPTTYRQPVLQVRVDPDGSVQARLGEDN